MRPAASRARARDRCRGSLSGRAGSAPRCPRPRSPRSRTRGPASPRGSRARRRGRDVRRVASRRARRRASGSPRPRAPGRPPRAGSPVDRPAAISRSAVRAASRATFPPPITTTSSPSSTRYPRLAFRRKSTARSTPSSSTPGMLRSRPRMQPTPRNTDANPSSFSEPSEKSRPSAWPVRSSTPMSRMARISSWSTSRRRRYGGMPSTIMPPGRSWASNTTGRYP